jgi:hypothetical protein
MFDKLFGAGTASPDELKAKIKEDAETQFAQQADQKLLGDVTEFLIESTNLIYQLNSKNGCKLLVRKNYLKKLR